ncbi:hypothetical protein [Solicola sp. PLA-1-18]|uniref:hypothetical protein n=1 Tax=Solicola sp. PLA-1-18 TaxID=3380532 RepID=UPI003B7870C7
MFAVTIDQDRSRTRPDAVPGLLTAVGDVPAVLPFERTIGDEVQALLDDPEAVVEVVARVAAAGGWALGVGVGDVESPLPASTREARGTAYLLARDAVEDAKRAPAVRLRGSDPETAEHAETALQVLAGLVAGRSEAGWEAVRAMADHATQAEAAAALGITPQAMNRRLVVAGWSVEERVRRLATHLLDVADLGSPS